MAKYPRKLLTALAALLVLATSACAVPTPATPTSTPPSIPTVTQTAQVTFTPTTSSTPTLTPTSTLLPLPPGAQLWQINDNVLLAVAYSPNGDHLAVAGSERVFIYQSETMELQSTLDLGVQLWSLAWSPDSEWLAVGSSEGKVSVWDVNSVTELSVVEIYLDHAIQSISWSPDGQRLAAGVPISPDRRPTTRVWDVATGEDSLTLEGVWNFYPFVAWSPDGEKLAGGCTCNQILIWDGNTGKSLLDMDVKWDLERIPWPEALAWSPSGDKLAFALGAFDVIQIYDPESGELEAELIGHTLEGISISWSPDGTRLASGSYDGTVRIWDMSTMQGEVVLSNVDWVSGVSWSPDGNHIAVASEAGLIIILDVNKLAG